MSQDVDDLSTSVYFQSTLPLTLRCTDSAQQRGFLGWPSRTGAPADVPVRAWGQDETLGTQASHVKSSEHEPRTRRSAGSGSPGLGSPELEGSAGPGRWARVAGPGSLGPGRWARVAGPGSARAPGQRACGQPVTSSTPATVRLPRRSTRNRPCNNSAGSSTASSPATRVLFT